MWEGDENVPGEKGPTPKQRSVERRCNDWAQPETVSVMVVTETNAQWFNMARNVAEINNTPARGVLTKSYEHQTLEKLHVNSNKLASHKSSMLKENLTS